MKDRLFGAILSFLPLALCKPYWIERFLEHSFLRLDTNLWIHLCFTLTGSISHLLSLA